MSDKDSSASSLGATATSKTSSYTPYKTTYRGTNSQGNRYDNRVQPCGPGYHYSNQNGSYYYKNGDNSKYYNDGKGGATYTAPNGRIYDKSDSCSEKEMSADTPKGSQEYGNDGNEHTANSDACNDWNAKGDSPFQSTEGSRFDDREEGIQYGQSNYDYRPESTKYAEEENFGRHQEEYFDDGEGGHDNTGYSVDYDDVDDTNDGGFADDDGGYEEDDCAYDDGGNDY